MKCHNLTCREFNSAADFKDNCSKQIASTCEFNKGCHNCNNFLLYEGCRVVLKCKNHSQWEAIP